MIPGLRRGVPSPAEPAPSPKHTLGELPPFIPALVQAPPEATPPTADAPPTAIPSLRRSARDERTVIPALGRRPEPAPTIPALTRAPSPAGAPAPAPTRETDAPLAATIPALTRSGSQPTAAAAATTPPPAADAPPLARIPDLKRPPSQPTEMDAPRPRPAPERAPGYVPPTLVHRQAQPAPTDATTIDALVSAAIAAGGRRETHAQRLRAIGAAAFLRIAQLFPGPLDLPRGDLRSLPSASAHGPLLRLCIALGEAITPYVLARLDDPDPNVRFYGALLFQELRSPGAVLPLARLAFDPDRDVRMIAMRVLETYHGAPSYADAVAELRGEIGEGTPSRRQQAIHAMGTLRDVVAVPLLIDALDHEDLELRGAALTALCSISGQHLGMASERWRAWHREKGALDRVEWMIESLGHRDPAVRKWASEELLRITGHAIQFDPRGDEASREAAIERWRAWWRTRKG